MWPFTPSWLKKAHDIEKAGRRFLNYKRDRLQPQTVERIEQILGSLRRARRERNRDQVTLAQRNLDEACAGALPPQDLPALRENVEVFFVALVIALAIKSFLLQPFMIPTGSMQPTLNGMKGTAMAEAVPAWNPLEQVGNRFLLGRKAVDQVLDRERVLVGLRKATIPIPAGRGFLGKFFDWTELVFADGGAVVVRMPMNTLLTDFGLNQRLAQLAAQQWPRDLRGESVVGSDGQLLDGGRLTLPSGTVLARGVLSFGDQVLVDRVSYHFRAPRRGEVFVFMTHGIGRLAGEARANNLDSQHYIKRLAGLPGDRLELLNGDPRLKVDGAVAEEPGIVRVGARGETAEGRYGGYQVPLDRATFRTWPVDRDGRLIMALAAREYAALGDNSAHSLDSRYWGPVPQENLVGPALLAYWPFHSHWGLID